MEFKVISFLFYMAQFMKNIYIYIYFGGACGGVTVWGYGRFLYEWGRSFFYYNSGYTFISGRAKSFFTDLCAFASCERLLWVNS
jgi:hypothetical protein